MPGSNTLLEKISRNLFHRNINYNGEFPSFINKVEPVTRLKYEEYLEFTKTNQERLQAYKEYDEMDTDIVASALDLWADDATQLNLQDGESLYIECEDSTVKSILENLFFQTLHIEEQLWNIARTTAKYGDYFVQVVGEDKLGVKFVNFDIAPSRVVRLDAQGSIAKFVVDKTIECSPWDFVHFKLPGAKRFDLNRSPGEGATSKEALISEVSAETYGQSAIDKARKTWKQLKLLEDSLVLSRLSRAFKRNVFMVNTAGLTEKAGWELIQKISDLLKKNRAINTSSGKMTSGSALMNPEEDIIIPVAAEKGQVTVQELGGEVDIKSIADIDYLNNKLFADLKTPKAYLGFEDALNGRNTLRMLDVRYARTVKNLQRVIILGLERIGRIHLSLLGRDPFAVDFRITLPYISTIEEVEKTEALSNKVDAVTRVLALIDQLDPNSDIVNRKALLQQVLGELGYTEDNIKELLPGNV